MGEDPTFNSNQNLIVEADDTPLLVIAGPGAGKTTILAARVKRLLASGKFDYARVLAISFTNVAAANLRTKLDSLPIGVVERVDVATFHGFAARLLQQHGSHIGLSPDFNIVNEEADRAELLVLALERISSPSESNKIKLLPLLARLYERCPDEANVKKYVDRTDPDILRKLFVAYRDTSIERRQLDFPLLVFLACQIMERVPAVATQIRKTYRYIFVDEFQDTNDAQYRLLKLICQSSARGLLFMADQDQVIYQWNGASTRRLAEAQAAFEMKIAIMPTSFRCPSNILSAANRLISHNSSRFVAPALDSAVEGDGEIVVLPFADERVEAIGLAERLTAISPAEYSETVVLARNRKILAVAVDAAIERGLKAIVPVQRFEFASPPMRLLHSILRLAHRPDDSRRIQIIADAFSEITSLPLDGPTLLAEAVAQECSPLDAFVAATGTAANSEHFTALCSNIADKLVARKDYRGFSAALFTWINALPNSQTERFKIEFEEEQEVWDTLERQHRGLESEHITLDEFLRRIDLESKTPPSGADTIKFMTVHGAKGLQFDRVFIMGAAEEQFPSFQSIRAGADSDMMQEERRSFFVAITRCKRQLILSHAARYFGYKKSPSRFIAEMGLEMARSS